MQMLQFLYPLMRFPEWGRHFTLAWPTHLVKSLCNFQIQTAIAQTSEWTEARGIHRYQNSPLTYMFQ